MQFLVRVNDVLFGMTAQKMILPFIRKKFHMQTTLVAVKLSLRQKIPHLKLVGMSGARLLNTQFLTLNIKIKAQK